MSASTTAPMLDLDAEIARYGDLLRKVGSWGKLVDLACPVDGKLDQTARDLFVFATERIRTYLLGTCEFIEHARVDKMDNGMVRKMGASFLRECYLLTHAVTLAHPRRMFYEATYGEESRHTFMDNRELRYAYMREEEQAHQFEEARKMGLTDHRSIHPPSLGVVLQKYRSMMPRRALKPEEWFAHTVGNSPILVGKIAPAVLAGTMFMEKVPDMPTQYQEYYEQLKKVWEELVTFWVAMPTQALSAFRLQPPLHTLGSAPKDELVHLAQFLESAPKTLARLNQDSTADVLLLEIFTHHLAGPDSSLPTYVVPAFEELHRLHPTLHDLANEGADLAFPVTAESSQKYLVDLMGEHAGALGKSVLPELSNAAVSAVEKEAAEYAILFATNAIDAELGRLHWTPPLDPLESKVTRYEHANLSVVQAPVCFYYRDVRSILYDSKMVVYSTLPRAHKALADGTALAEALYAARDVALAELSLLRHTHRDALLRIQRASLKSGRYLDGLAEEHAMRRALSTALHSPALMHYVRVYMADITASRTFKKTESFLHELAPTHYARMLVEVALGRVSPPKPILTTTPTPKVDILRPVMPSVPTPAAVSVAQVAGQVVFRTGHDAPAILNQPEPLQEILDHWTKVKNALKQYYLSAEHATLTNAELDRPDRLGDTPQRALLSAAHTTNDRKAILTRIALAISGPAMTVDAMTVDAILEKVLQGGEGASGPMTAIETMVKGKKLAQANWIVPDTAALHVWLGNVVAELIPLHEHALIAETSYAVFILLQLAALRQDKPALLNYDTAIQVAWGNYCVAYHHLSLGMGNSGRWATGPGSLLESVYKTPVRLFHHATAGHFQPLPIDLADDDVAEFVADEVGVISSIVHYWVGDFAGGDSVMNSALQWSSESAFTWLGKKVLGEYALKPGGKAYPVKKKPSEFISENAAHGLVLNALGFEVSFAPKKFYIKIPRQDVTIFEGSHVEDVQFSFENPTNKNAVEILKTVDGVRQTYTFDGATTTVESATLGNDPGVVLPNSTVTPGWALIKTGAGMFFAEVEERKDGPLQKMATEADLLAWNTQGVVGGAELPGKQSDILKWVASGFKCAQLVFHQWRGMRPISREEEWQKVHDKVSEETEEHTRILYIADTFAPSSLISTGEEWVMQKYLPVARAVASNYGSGKVKGALVGSVATFVGNRLAETKYSVMANEMVLFGLVGSVITIFALMLSIHPRRRGIPGLNALTTLVGLGSMFMYFIGWMVGDAQTVFSMIPAPWK